MSVISKLTTIAAGGGGKDSAWIMELQDPSNYSFLLTGVEQRDAPTGGNGNIVVVGLQDSSGEDGAIMEIDPEGSIISQRIQNNNTYTYYNSVFEHYWGDGKIYTGGAMEPSGGSIAQGITRFSSPTSIQGSKNVDISGGNSGIIKYFDLTYNGTPYAAIVGSRGTQAFSIIRDDLSSTAFTRYWSQSRTSSYARGYSSNYLDVTCVSESNDSGVAKVDVCSFPATNTSSTSWAKGFWMPSPYFFNCPDSIGFQGIKFWDYPSVGAFVGNTNVFNTSIGNAVLVTLTGSNGAKNGDPTWIVNEDGTYRQTQANGLTQDEGSSSKEIFVFSTVNAASTTDALFTRHHGTNGSVQQGLQVRNSDTGGYLEIFSIVAKSGDSFYAVGRVNQTSYSKNRGVIMKLPKDLLTTGTFGKYVLSTPTINTSNMGLYTENLSPSIGTFNAGTVDGSETLSSYSTTNTLQTL